MAGSQEVFQHAMNQGHSAAWDQSWDKAASYYRQALKYFPDNPQALTSLGLALIELQEFDEALRCYVRAAKVLSDDPIPFEKIAQISERLGNLEQAAQASLRAAELYIKNREVSKAVDNWERVTRLTPENLQAHTRLALVFERMGEKEKSVIEYLAVASILQSSGNLEKAIQAVNQAQRVLPGNEEADQALASLKDFKLLPKPARPRGGTAPLRMSQVRKLQAPQDAAQPESDPVSQACQKALTILAGMLFEASEEEETEQASRRGFQAIVTGTGVLHKPLDRTRMILHLSQVVDLQTKGEAAQAADELQRAMDVGLEHPAAYFDLGYLYYLSGRMESSIRQLQHSVKHVDFSLGTRLLLGDLMRKKGHPKEAAIEYLEALKLADAQIVRPDQAEDLRQLYEPLIESQRHKPVSEATEQMCDNIRDMLMRPDWRTHLGRAREQLPGKTVQGPPVPLAEILTEVRSGRLLESISAIFEMKQNGNLRSAMEEAFYALDDAPTYLPLHSLMGDMLVEQGELQAAVAKMQVVARTYNMRGESQQAINLYRRVVELAPADIGARGRLIDQLLSAGHEKDAIQEYIQLAEVYVSMADFSAARKTYTEALRTAQQANIDRSLRVKIMHRMADINLQSVDWRQALRIFEQIRTLQPDDEQARSRLVELNFRLAQEQQALAELDNYLSYLSENKQEKKAQDFLVSLVREDPSRVPVRRRLSDLYRHRGQIKEAVSQLDAIGELLLDAGDRSGAIQTVEMILALNPPDKGQYQRLLSQLRSGKN
jgi:tetratricopeptide (TPR) repeat protein